METGKRMATRQIKLGYVAFFTTCLILTSQTLSAMEGYVPYFNNQLQATYRATPAYPREELRSGNAGGVSLVFLVDRHGKPFAPTVLGSTATSFEITSLNVLTTYQFPPSPDSETNVIGRVLLNIYYELETYPSRPSKKFNKLYKKIFRQINDESKDPESLARSLRKMQKINSIPPSAIGYLNLLEYKFASKFGTQNEQLIELQTADIGFTHRSESNKKLEQLRVFNLDNLIRTQRNLKDYGSALYNFELLRKVDADTASIVAKEIKEVFVWMNNDESLETPVVIPERGNTSFYLLKNRMSIRKTSGTFTKVILRCDRMHHELEFTNELTFDIPKEWGTCHLEVIGDSGSTATLTQSSTN
jgi:hypothetical protein